MAHSLSANRNRSENRANIHRFLFSPYRTVAVHAHSGRKTEVRFAP